MTHRNSQRLHALELEAIPRREHAHLSLWIDSEHFGRGYIQGLTDTQAYPRFDMHSQATEAGIVEIVRNLVEMGMDNELTDDVLLHDCGLLAGWLLRHDVLINQTLVHCNKEAFNAHRG